MDPLSRIEHTILGPETTPADVRTLLDEAQEYGLRACVPPGYVELATDYAPGVDLATVVGFPHGNTFTQTKVEEAKRATRAGADELDMVCQVGLLQAGQDSEVRADIEAVAEARHRPLKVIIETPLLSEAEIHRASQLVRGPAVTFSRRRRGSARAVRLSKTSRSWPSTCP